MLQRRSTRSAPRTRSLALGGALAALAVVGGGTVAVVAGPTEVAAGDIRLAQNAAAQQMELGAPVDLDLEPVVARAAGGAIPAGTTVQVTGLPDGLVQNGWVISGTPTRAGEYEVLVTVSNSGVSRSQKVAVTVTEDAPAATVTEAAPAATTTGAAPADDATTPADEAPSDQATSDQATAEPGMDASGDEVPGQSARGAAERGAGTETSPSAGATGQAAPTLSAAPGTPAAGEDTDAPGQGGGTGTSPDLCAVLGDGQLDGASLSTLLPALTGDDDAASSGLVLVLVNAVLSMLPAVLGESGSTEDLGSAGQLLCTLPPALLGGQAGGSGGTGVGGTGVGGDGAAGGGAVTDGQAGGAAGAAQGLNPLALLGMLTGTGSAG